MRDLGALIYLETRMAVHRFQRVLHQPARLTLWIIFILWFATFLVARAYRASDQQFALLVPGGAYLLYAFVPAAFVAIIGMQVSAGTHRPPATFAYPADARFLLGSRLSSLAVVFWLQLREAIFQGMRVFLGLFFVSWNFAADARSFFFSVAALLSAYVIAYGVRLPVFVAQRRLPALPLSWVGAALIGTGISCVLSALVLAARAGRLSLNAVASLVPSFAPGTWVVHALGGDSWSLFALVACACAVIGVGSAAAMDAYPELWEASSRLYARRAIVASGKAMWNREAWRELQDAREGGSAGALRQVRSLHGEGAPGGALAIGWREWIALRRSVGGLQWPIFWTCLACVLGYGAGVAARGRTPFEIAVPLIAFANILVVVGSQSTVNLGSELRRPLWWLSRSRVRDRVASWMLCVTMRVVPPLVAGTAAAGVALRSPLLAVLAAPLVVTGVALVQCIGVATYVALPGRNDMRGPGFMLRVLTTYTALGPPVLAWVLVQTVARNPLAGAVAGLSLGLLEAWSLLLFSAKHLEENAMAYATAEER